MDRSGRGASVETHRVREAATSGLTIALAAAFLMVTCNVADQRNVQVDLSYFKTSSPGESSQNIVKSLVDQDLTVLLFFADVSEVADEVHAYFDALQQASGNVVIERYDPIAASGAAKEHKVSKEGTIVFKLGDKTEKLNINPDIEKARRNELRELDKKVQQALMKVVREKKTACLSVGHGELNQSTTQRPNVLGIPGTGIDKATQLRGWLRFLNYEVQDYKSFGQPVPKNCTVLIVLSPLVPLSDETSRAIDDFLADGGSLLYVLDPIGQATLGPILEPRLGVKYEPAPLADDKLFRPIRRNQSDHQYVATTEFTAHASVTTASRAGAGVGLVFLRSGSLSDVPFQDEGTTRSYPIKSMSTTWQELSQPPNWTYDGSEEQRRQRNIMAAIQGPTVGGAPNTGFRAIVLADAELFSDLVLKRDQFQATLPQMIVLDAIRWLGGEEALIGDVQDEKDVPIEHTRNEDVVWFYTTILGFPILVLGLGLVWVTISRRRSGRRRAS